MIFTVPLDSDRNLSLRLTSGGFDAACSGHERLDVPLREWLLPRAVRVRVVTGHVEWSLRVRSGSHWSTTVPCVHGPVCTSPTTPPGVSTVSPREVLLFVDVVSACR